MKRILALALTCAVSLVGSPLFAAAPKGSPVNKIQPPTGQQSNGSIYGTATTQTGEVLPNLTAQLRDLATGQVVGTQTTNDKGEYCFANLQPGNYAVEALNPAGQVIGTSASISLSAGQSITGVVLQAAAGLLTAGAAAAAGAAGGIGAGLSTAVLIAVAAFTAFIGAQTGGGGGTNASPSR